MTNRPGAKERTDPGHRALPPGAWVAGALALMLRDARLIARRPSRIAAAILTPAMLWAFFAGGFADSFGPGGSGNGGAATDGAGGAYTLSLAAGSALLVATFTSIFGALTMIRDRESGFLQSVLVGPTPRWVVISARIASGAMLAFIQAAPMLLAAAALVPGVGLDRIAAAMPGLLMACVGLSGLCTALAWHFDSIEGFHGIMAGLLMPAWLLSGAVFPPDAPAGLMRWIIAFNPLAHAHRAMSGPLGAGPLGATDAHAASAWLTAVFAVGAVVAAIAAARGDARR